MFFKQVKQNAARNRKNNGIFFGSLIIAIVAFYTLLSLESQDVIRFLKTLERDAIKNLFTLIPIIYVISLFFVFFLVYFAYRYQLESRRKEFGLYLMLGMKRSTLFWMLVTETLWNSLISVAVGLPIALLLTEIVSLTTVKLVGLGIIGHQLSFSLLAILGTIVGFISTQLLATFILSIQFTRKEPVDLLASDAATKQKSQHPLLGIIAIVIGSIFLGIAYYLGVSYFNTFQLEIIGFTLLSGTLGTFLFYKGIGTMLGMFVQKKSMDKSGLYIFTSRQVQENILYQYKTVAVASLLMLAALTCVIYGTSFAASQNAAMNKTVDITIEGNAVDVVNFLEEKENKDMIEVYYPLQMALANGKLPGDDSATGYSFTWNGLLTALKQAPTSPVVENIEAAFKDYPLPYLIPQSAFNQFLLANGKEPLYLGAQQAAMYTNLSGMSGYIEMLNQVLPLGASMEIDGVPYALAPQVYADNIVADRTIQVYTMLILPDEAYYQFSSTANESIYWNVHLKPELIKKDGLMQTIHQFEKNLAPAGFVYETFIKSVGRTVFYIIAASYLTIYLGILFLIIANTVIGIKYLMQQRTSEPRYQTLLMLGAENNALEKSARTQISMFFFLTIGLASISSVFAIWSMLNGLVRLKDAQFPSVIIAACISGFVFLLIEYIYIRIIQNVSNREIRALQVGEKD